jgi:predicted TIM-barrel fold metal-dependent hydrolase
MTIAPDAPLADTIVDGRYVIVSTDGHAGAAKTDYKPYLVSSLHDEFDAWLAAFDNPFADLEGELAYRNWDSKRRLAELSTDGVAAEVLYPNTIPPFFPSANLAARPPDAGEYQRRWEGLKAHNRWMADFCNDTPGRRAGLAQILLHDVDEAVAEIRWAKDAGLFGGILLPGIPPDSGLTPYIDPRYEPIWAVCSELDMPINHHTAGANPDYGPFPATGWMFFVEAGFFSHRALWMLIFAGVFERYPNLKLVLTEGGADWVPGVVAILDHQYHKMDPGSRTGFGELSRSADGQAKRKGGMYGGLCELAEAPSYYYRNNVWIGSSFTTRREALMRDEVGIDKMMWGNDYPHREATWPFTREALRHSFFDVEPVDVARMLGGNALEVYPFDLRQLSDVAVEIEAPTVSEIRVPLDEIPADATSMAFETGPRRIW